MVTGTFGFLFITVWAVFAARYIKLKARAIARGD